jgi:hypothetical protein
MTHGLGRFEYYLIQLDELLIQASKTENPALYLYKNDARTKAFMLEGLSKLYAGMHNEKRFSYVKAYFKTLEDMLGLVDYYDSFAKQFFTDPEMLTTIRIFMEQKRDEKLYDMNVLLLKKRWINNERPRTKKIRRKIKKADWLEPDKEIAAIQNFYKKAIKEINSFYKQSGEQFVDIEAQVHELRRKLRWLSIYPQALQGAIQFADNDIKDDALTKYLTDDIVNSPYNKMPAAGNNKTVLQFEKKYFLALSSIISQLGKLKDEGLQILATAEAIESTQFVDKAVALQKAYELNKINDEGLKNIMAKAKAICAPFFEENNLRKMIVGVKNL